VTARVTYSKARFERWQKKLRDTEDKTKVAMVSAVNDTLRQVRSLASRRFRSKIALNKEFVDKRLRLRRATSKRPTGIVWVSKKMISASRFKPTQRKAGVTIKVRKGGARTMLKGAFGPKRPRLKGGVYRRSGYGLVRSAVRQANRLLGRRKGGGREPIRTVPGYSLAAEAWATGMMRQVLRERKALLKKNLERRLRFVRLALAGQIKQARGSA